MPWFKFTSILVHINAERNHFLYRQSYKEKNIVCAVLYPGMYGKNLKGKKIVYQQFWRLELIQWIFTNCPIAFLQLLLCNVDLHFEQSKFEIIGHKDAMAACHSGRKFRILYSRSWVRICVAVRVSVCSYMYGQCNVTQCALSFCAFEKNNCIFFKGHV
jgi:hypothetical protein